MAGDDGESLATKSAHTRASLLTFMHQTRLTLDKIAPTGDNARDRTAPFFDYHLHYLQLLISLRRIRSPVVRSR